MKELERESGRLDQHVQLLRARLNDCRERARFVGVEVPDEVERHVGRPYRDLCSDNRSHDGPHDPGDLPVRQQHQSKQGRLGVFADFDLHRPAGSLVVHGCDSVAARREAVHRESAIRGGIGLNEIEIGSVDGADVEACPRHELPLFVDDVALQHGLVEVQISLESAVIALAQPDGAEVPFGHRHVALHGDRPGVVLATG